MPEFKQRRYQRGNYQDPKNWTVIDTQTGLTVFSGRYAESSLALHNLNKKHYNN